MLKNQKIESIPVKDLGMLFPNETSKRKRRYWLYKCYCGNYFKARVDSIKNGNTNSCGCYHKAIVTTHGMTNHPLYNTWDKMKERTSNQNHKSYKNYGGRGITVCDRWLNVKNFIEDMYPTYEHGLTLDRIDNNKGYSKDNCRWVTKSIQSRNTIKIRKNNSSGYRGVTWNKTSKKWCSQIGLDSKRKHIGCFSTALEAAMAYDRYVLDNNLEHTINNIMNQ